MNRTTAIHTVLTTLDFPETYMEQLKQAFSPAEWIALDRRDDAGIKKALETADVALLNGEFGEEFLHAPLLKWIHCNQAGLNNAARPALFDTDLIVTSAAGRSGPALAEHCMFFMLNLAYNFPAFYEAQKKHQYGGIPGQQSLSALLGRTVGIIGLGHTGKELAARAKAFGMTVLGYRRRTAEVPGVDRLFSQDRGDSLDDMLAQSDFVAVTLPLSDATYHLIGERELHLMKPGSFIVNLGRGDIIDEEALVAALKEGHIGGAGLDTFSKEPLPAESPLWDCPNLLLTPHCTPGLPDRIGRCVSIILENAAHYRAGEPLINVLTREDVYTK